MAVISTSLAGVCFRNPAVLASGILGVTASSLARAADAGAGAVTTKSFGPEKREGHDTPVIAETERGLLNAVGLSCPPLDESIEELREAVRRVRAPVIASIYGKTAEEFGYMAERVSEARPAMIEANISCPNVECEFGRPFGTDPAAAAKVTARIKEKTKIPISVKLTPNVTDISSIAKAVEAAGANAITAVNTFGPGMSIDLESATPVLSNKSGGYSGPAVKPLAVRCVYQLYEAVQIPIIGVGGVSNWKDAVEMLLAGASAVGVGTAVMYGDLAVFSEISSGIGRFMDSHSCSSIKDLIGRAHR